MTRVAALAGLLLAAAACGLAKKADPPPPASVKVITESVVVKRGTIGLPGAEPDPANAVAAYVLVDIENGSAEDRLVAADGELLDAAGATVEPLNLDELLVPAGKRRTFALVGGNPTVTGTAARVRVLRAPVAKFPEYVALQDLGSERDDGALVANVRVQNTIDQPIVVTLIASFHDDAGHILARPVIFLDFDPKKSRPYRFVGPKAATKVDVYLGQVAY